MHLKQSDLFLGLGHNFIKETMGIAQNVSYKGGEYVFREGDPADSFYIMIKGKIRLILGYPGKVVYTTSGVGDLLGCSCLMGWEFYFLSAQCEEASVLLRLDQKKMNRILDNDVDNSLFYFKNLSSALGKRLMEMYQKFAAKTSTAIPD